MEKNEKLPTITPQQQLWNRLRTDEQKQILSNSLRYLKEKYQEDLVLALVAYLRLGIVRRFDDPWLNGYFLSMLVFIKAEKAEGRL